MLPVYQAFDRVKFSEVPTDDARALEDKLERASRAFADRDGWLAPHHRIVVLRELARLVDEQRERFTQLIAREGGKPYTDAAIEVARAIDGVRDAAEELRNFGGREIPMGLTQASVGRQAFTALVSAQLLVHDHTDDRYGVLFWAPFVD
jgi:acyl-CoA reductase-like NAD-dependent aldehyde dehydrogenase